VNTARDRLPRTSSRWRTATTVNCRPFLTGNNEFMHHRLASILVLLSP